MVLGGAEEERPGDAVDHDVPVGALSARIGGAVAGGVGLVLVEEGRPALDRDELRHAVHEQEAAEHDADHDALGEVPEDRQKERREEHERLAARAASGCATNSCRSAMFQATTARMPASAASGM